VKWCVERGNLPEAPCACISNFDLIKMLQLREDLTTTSEIELLPIVDSVYLRRTEQIDDPQRSILSSLARLLQLTSDLPISLAILCHLGFSSLINNSANFLSYTSVRHPANLTSSGVKVSIIERRRAYPSRSPSAVIAEIMFLRNLTSWLVLSGCSNIRPTQFVDFFEFDNLLCVVDGPRNIGHTFLQAI